MHYAVAMGIVALVPASVEEGAHLNEPNFLLHTGVIWIGTDGLDKRHTPVICCLHRHFQRLACVLTLWILPDAITPPPAEGEREF